MRRKEIYVPNLRFLQGLREDRGYGQAEFAIRCGLQPQSYARYEKSGLKIRLDFLSRIRQELGLTWNELGRFIDGEK